MVYLRDIWYTYTRERIASESFSQFAAERGRKRAANEVQRDVETKSFLIYEDISPSPISRIFIPLCVCESIFLSNEKNDDQPGISQRIRREGRGSKSRSARVWEIWKLEWFCNEGPIFLSFVRLCI